jgi:hypothetical protein
VIITRSSYCLARRENHIYLLLLAEYPGSRSQDGTRMRNDGESEGTPCRHGHARWLVMEVMKPFERRPGTGKSLRDGCIADRYSKFKLVVYMVEVRARNEIGLRELHDVLCFSHTRASRTGLTHAGAAFNVCPSLSCHPCLLLLTMLQTHPLPQFNDARTIYANSSYRAYAAVQSLSRYSSNTPPSFARIWRPSRASLK